MTQFPISSVVAVVGACTLLCANRFAHGDLPPARGSANGTGEADASPAYQPSEGSPVAIRFRAAWPGHSQRAKGIAFSPDGKLLASSGATDAAGSGEKQNVLVRDAATGKVLHTFPSTYGATHDVAFSPDGKHLVSADDNGVIQVFDPQAGKVVRTFRTGKNSEGVPALEFLPDGQLAIATDRRGGLALWQIEGKQEFETNVHKSRAWDLAVSPNGRWVVTGSADRTFAIWSATMGQLVWQSESQGTWVTALAVSPDSKRLAVGDYYSNIRIWDLQKREPVLDIRKDAKQHMQAVHTLTFSPDGRYLISTQNPYKQTTTRVWDTQSGALLGELDTKTEMVLGVTFSPDGKTLALACTDGSVQVYDWRIREKAGEHPQ